MGLARNPAQGQLTRLRALAGFRTLGVPGALCPVRTGSPGPMDAAAGGPLQFTQHPPR